MSSTAVVVGSGPNGLTAAVLLARAGVRVTVLEAAERIGGGTRSAELTVPGVLHDECSAVHPMGIASPAWQEFRLERYGLRWCHPEIDLAHPLDDSDPALLYRSLDRTVAGLGADARTWRRLFGRLAQRFDAVNADILQPVIHLPRHPLLLARFGLPALTPASVFVRQFKETHAQVLFGGSAAHTWRPLTAPGSSAIGVAQLLAAHAVGWPVPAGGSQAIADALAAALTAHGGTIHTGVRVRSLADLPAADAVLLDLAPEGAADVLGDKLPGRVARAYRRYRHGPSAYKLDLAVRGGIPWRDEACRRAGTLHLGGTFAELAAAEQDTADGRLSPRPFMLVGQQYLADPSRSNGDIHPVWTYAHVPAEYAGDATDVLLDQIERFAPGTRSRIVASAVRTPADFARDNANYVRGDIVTGANDLRQLLFRPRVTLRPYRTGAPGVYLCSAATPPGAGVHGMCGANAARVALRDLEREAPRTGGLTRR